MATHPINRKIRTLTAPWWRRFQFTRRLPHYSSFIQFSIYFFHSKPVTFGHFWAHTGHWFILCFNSVKNNAALVFSITSSYKMNSSSILFPSQTHRRTQYAIKFPVDIDIIILCISFWRNYNHNSVPLHTHKHTYSVFDFGLISTHLTFFFICAPSLHFVHLFLYLFDGDVSHTLAAYQKWLEQITKTNDCFHGAADRSLMRSKLVYFAFVSFVGQRKYCQQMSWKMTPVELIWSSYRDVMTNTFTSTAFSGDFIREFFHWFPRIEVDLAFYQLNST